MANLSEDIQCAESDTRPPMLDRTDFAYATTKHLLKGMKERYNADIRATNILLQGLPKDIYTLINHYTDAKDIWDSMKMLLEGSELTKEDRESQLYDDFEHFRQNKEETIHDYYVRFSKLINDMRNIKMNSKFVNNMLPEWGRFVTAVKLNRGLRDSNYDQLVDRKSFKEQCRVSCASVYEGSQNKLGMQSMSKFLKRPQLSGYNYNDQDNVVDEDVDEQPVHDLALNVDNVFQADVYPVYDEAGPSYDSDILSEVHDHDHYQDAVCEHHEEHEMHDDVQPNYVVDSHANYTSDSNMIPYDQYVKDNAVPVVQSNVSSVPNDAYMMIFNDMHEPHAQSVSDTTRNTVVDNSLTAELATYKEQVELYERRARFELTEREQKIDEQLRIVITDRNIKEENLKKELHSVKMQLASTINHNKSMVEEVTSLKKDFKQKENKYLEEFLDMKALKEKVEDKLYKQDQSLQTVHMLCKPKPYYNEQNKVAIGYKNPLCLTRAKQVQPALYNGYEIIKNNHVPALVHNTEDTLEIAEITRRKMNDKMKDPECVTHKVKIAPPDYSKENYLATFTPQKQLTPEQIFWSQDLIKMKEEALKKQTTTSRPIKALTVYPPNTPATLVPRVLPTKSQVKINIFTLIQLFSEFKKTCKKRITPTGLTEGERGFEQTKECYLTEVIPFFNTLKEHFEGIQKALTKKIKEMKDIFKELEAEDDDIMANVNIPANDALVEQAPVVAPPTRMDDQILPLSKWMPIGKSNCVLDVHRPQRNPIFPIAVALLKNTNFFRAFTASSTIPAIYIQQFWDTIDALDISSTNDNNPFVAPPSSDTVIEYVNMLGYPNTLRNVSAMSVNALYQPWRAILSMINMCLTGKTVGYDRPIHPTFLTDRKNLATAACGKKKTAHLLIPSVSILNTLGFIGKDGREIFGMPIPDALLTDEIKGAKEGGAIESSNATKVTKPKAAKVTKPSGDKVPKATATQPPKPKPTPTQPSKAVSEKKRKLVKETPDEPSPTKRSKGGLVGKRRKPKSPLKLVDEPSDEGVPVEEPAHTDEEADLQRELELSLKEQAERTQGLAYPIVLREPDFGNYQPLLEVQGKGKEKVVDEQATYDLLTLQTPTKKIPID
ncbi:retrovirus-related pol polyprotein from transposon TNT 1-94 [Tanacetum coccineum]